MQLRKCALLECAQLRLTHTDLQQDNRCHQRRAERLINADNAMQAKAIRGITNASHDAARHGAKELDTISRVVQWHGQLPTAVPCGHWKPNFITTSDVLPHLDLANNVAKLLQLLV